MLSGSFPHWLSECRRYAVEYYAFFRYEGYYYLDLYTPERTRFGRINFSHKTIFSIDDGYKKKIYPWETILQAKEHDPALGCYTNLIACGPVQKYFAFPVGDCHIEDVPDNAFPCYYVAYLIGDDNKPRYTDFRDDRDRGAVINARDSIIRGTGRADMAAVACSWVFAFLVRHTANRKGSKRKTSIT